MYTALTREQATVYRTKLGQLLQELSPAAATELLATALIATCAQTKDPETFWEVQVQPLLQTLWRVGLAKIKETRA